MKRVDVKEIISSRLLLYRNLCFFNVCVYSVQYRLWSHLGSDQKNSLPAQQSNLPQRVSCKDLKPEFSS